MYDLRNAGSGWFIRCSTNGPPDSQQWEPGGFVCTILFMTLLEWIGGIARSGGADRSASFGQDTAYSPVDSTLVQGEAGGCSLPGRDATPAAEESSAHT